VEASAEINPDDVASDILDGEADIQNTISKELSDAELQEYVCEFDGIELGTVKAVDEEDAYHKMQAEWPDLPYGLYDGVAAVYCTNCSDDDMSDVELAQKLEEYKNNK